MKSVGAKNKKRTRSSITPSSAKKAMPAKKRGAVKKKAESDSEDDEAPDTSGDVALAQSLAGKRVSARNLDKKGKQFKKQAALAKIREVRYYFMLDISAFRFRMITTNLLFTRRIGQINMLLLMNPIVNSITGETRTTLTTTTKTVTCSNLGRKRERRSSCLSAPMKNPWATRMTIRHQWDRLKGGRKILRPNLRIITMLWCPVVNLSICAMNHTSKRR